MTNKVIVSKVVGELQVIGEASSDRRDISMQDLLNIAMAATGEQEVTGAEGVNINIIMSGPDAPAMPEPLFTPAEEEKAARPKGVHVGGVTKAVVVQEQARKQRELDQKRDNIIDTFKQGLRSCAMGMRIDSHEQVNNVIDHVINTAAITHRQMIVAYDNKDEAHRLTVSSNQKLYEEKCKLEEELAESEELRIKATREAVSAKNECERLANMVENTVQTRHATELELIETKKQLEELQRRMNAIRELA